jgi:hypothetical protein
MNYTILDLDNCISNDGWRQHWLGDTNSFSRNKKLEAYHSGCGIDDFNWYPDIPFPENVVIFTGRPIKYILATKLWLAKNNINTDLVYMRPNGNKMPSHILKMHFLKMFLEANPGAVIDMAYDDRAIVLEMYKKQGIQQTMKRINKNVI